jgi:hypothetical protein
MHDTQRLESWLAAEVFGTPTAEAPSTFLSHLDPVQRTRLLYDLLDRRPGLAAATRRLSLYDQLRLSVELVNRTTSTPTVPGQRHPHAPSARARCFVNTPGMRRRPQLRA